MQNLHIHLKAGLIIFPDQREPQSLFFTLKRRIIGLKIYDTLISLYDSLLYLARSSLEILEEKYLNWGRRKGVSCWVRERG